VAPLEPSDQRLDDHGPRVVVDGLGRVAEMGDENRGRRLTGDQPSEPFEFPLVDLLGVVGLVGAEIIQLVPG